MGTRGVDPVVVRRSLETLGLDETAAWEDIVRAHRAALFRSHPDRAGEGPESTERTIQLNTARAELHAATDGGARALAGVLGPAVAEISHLPATGPIELHTRGGDPFVGLLEAAYAIGDVSYIDPEAGLIQVLLDAGDPTAAQLLISLDIEADPPSATFTLDTMDRPESMPIRQVVERLAAALANPAS